MFSKSLYQSFTLPNQLSIVEGQGGFPYIKIDNDNASALISIYGGQILSYKKKTGQDNEAKDLFFVSEKAYFEQGKAIKGGVPICWPWFGQDQENVGNRAHGFARNTLWQLDKTSSNNSGETVVVLSLTDTAETQKLWPHAFSLTLTIVVGENLHLSLKTTNTSNNAFVITQAFHSYFAVDDILEAKVTGLDKVPYIDTVGGVYENKTQQNDVTFTQEVDRIYVDAPSALKLLDESGNKRIKINSRGSKTAIVWNPWKDKSANSGDLSDDAYQQFVCVETGNAVDDKVTLKPKESHALEVEYSIIEA